MALRTDNASVSAVVGNQLGRQEAWEALLSDPESADWGQSHGSFGNVRSVRAEERTEWSERLEAWLEAYIQVSLRCAS